MFNMVRFDFKSIICFDFVVGIMWNEIRCLQVCVGAMEEEAVGCDEVLAEGEVLGVPSAPFDCACHSPHPP